MNVNKRRTKSGNLQATAAFIQILLWATCAHASDLPASPSQGAKPQQGSAGAECTCAPSTNGSPYIPVDSWVYPAVMRLYSMGYVDDVYLGMRPWTRTSVIHMLEAADAQIEDARNYVGSTADEAQSISAALSRLLHYDAALQCEPRQRNYDIESVYSVARGISGTPLRDSYHIGSTIINDYGRPYASGINSYSGASGYAGTGRFVLYVRGEFQATPSAAGYSSALTQQLSAMDGTTYTFSNAQNSTTLIPLDQLGTLPFGPIGSTTTPRVVEAYASVQYLSHVISFGKQDDWLGPGLGGGMAYSNNAENIYSFRIDRIEPLYIPLLSRITGPFRYDFLVGQLGGHVYPANPWVHVEQVSFRPTGNLEFGFERTAIWGGEGHVPITIKSFLRSFFSLSAPQGNVKFSRTDPGARFGSFNFSYRLPFVRNWLTLYTDSDVHDDVSSIDAPRRASWRPGLYLSHVPGVPKLDIRAEAAYTDPPITNSNGGHFMYYEGVQREGYTNRGALLGDWIGREDKGGQAWITYHLSGNEWIQAGVRNQKAAKDFIPGGTTLNDINIQAVKRIGKNFEINGNFEFEKYKAPIYMPGEQTVTTTTIQLTWFPERKVSF